MPQLEEQTRRDIAAFLPEAIETALESYRSFSMEQATNDDDDDNSDKFKKHHDACKVAIAHIKLLIELAKWADLPNSKLESGDDKHNLRLLLSNAQGELSEKTVD